MPVVSRCAQTIAQDGAHGGINYNSGDRFCLNGQRLIVISGTYGADGSEYRTEIDNFTKVLAHGTAGNGPAWFEVHEHDGLTLEYGNSASSQILAVGTSTARVWALDKVTDKKGNYYTVTYTNDTTNGQFYPLRIDYTGNASAGLATYNSVQFTYNTARPDVVPMYNAGSLQKTTVLLTDIKTFQGANLVHDYKLGYRLGSSTLHSRLTSLTQCDPNNACLPATTFTWQGGTGPGAMSSLAIDTALAVGDFNGDGLTDYLASQFHTNCVAGQVMLGTQTVGSFTPSTMTITDPSMNPPVGPACFFFPMTTLMAADFTGSGFASVADSGSVSGSIKLYLNDTHGNFNAFTSPSATQNTVGGDYDGDGRRDILDWNLLSNQAPFPGQFLFQLSNGDGTFRPDTTHTVATTGWPSTTPVYKNSADHHGDGCSDLNLVTSSTSIELYFRCSGSVFANVSGFAPAVLGDFNGDGKVDALGYLEPSGTTVLMLSTGTGMVQVNTTSLPLASCIVPGDINGDGKDDVACTTNVNGSQVMTFYLSTGTDFVSTGQTANFFGASPQSYGDINNDGAADIADAGAGWVSFAYTPELVTGISNGIGASTTITYDRLNKNGSFYTKGTSSTYPLQDFDGPMYVVSQVQTSNGIGGNFTKTYAYTGAVRDLQGRGFLGFGSVKETDLQTNVVDTRNFRLDYPFVGLLSSETRTHSSTNLSTTTNTYTSTNLGGTRYFVGLQQSVVTAHDLDGTALPTTTTAYTYDSYGNALTENISLTDSSHRNTTNTYTNDTVNWILGQETQTSVESSVTNPGAPPPPQPPVAVEDHIYTNGTVPVSFDPRTNDTGGSLSVTGVSTPSHGTATFTNTQVTYTAGGSGNLQDQFTYTIQNASGTASATVYVNTDTASIVARNEQVTVQQRKTLSYDPRVNDDDPDGDSLTITTVGTPSHGTATILNNGTVIKYVPSGSYVGTDSFTYTVSDGHGKTATATESINVISGTPGGPTAVNDSYNVSGTSFSFDPRANDTDPQGDTLTVLSKTNPLHGTATIQLGGQGIVYTPTPGYSGTDSFTYKDTDGVAKTSNSATITLTVSGSGGGGGGGATAGTSTITRTTSYVHDPATGLVTRQIIEPSSNFALQSDYTYDAFGNRLTTTVSGAGGGPIAGIVTRASSVAYDSLGQFALTATNPLSQVEHFITDARFGTPTSRSDINGITTTWTYDTFGRRTRQANPDGTIVNTSYQICTTGCQTNGAYTMVTTPVLSDGVTQNGPQAILTYDSIMRLIDNETQTFDATWGIVQTQYDANGRVLKTSRPYFESGGSPAWTTFTYDDLGRVTQATMPDNSHSTYAFHGLTRSVTNDKSQVATTVSNMQGHVANVTDAALGVTTYSYDAFGGLLGITDASGNGFSNTFDIRGNKTSSIDPDLRTWTYGYDSLGELVTQTDAKSQITNLNYDTVGRVTQRVEPTFTSTWTWDTASHGVGALASATTGSGYTRTLTYDTLGRPLTTTLTIDGTAQTYSLTYNSTYGLIGTVTYPSGFTALKVYTSLGYLSQIKDNATGSALVTVNNRDAELHLTQSTFGNSVVTTDTFDANTGHLTNVRSGPSDSVAAFDYIWDTIGNLVYRSDNGQGVFERYCYDSLNRLTQSALAVGSDPGTNCINGTVKAMSYDPIGNITSKSDVGTYSYPAPGSPLPHAVASIAGTVNGVSNPSYAYDLNGNLTAGAGRTVTWNSFNMAASIVEGTTTIGLFYDDGHSRIKQTAPSSTTYYLNDPASANLSEKVVAGSTTTWHDYIAVDGHLIAERFCTGASPCTSGSTMSYFALDHLSSVASVTNDAGTVVERDAYDPWGKRRNVNGNDDPICALTSLTTRGFTGHEHIDSVCEINANARIYDPTIGRFMSADPIDLPVFDTTGRSVVPAPIQEPQSLNRYSYVDDEPTDKTDPTGKFGGEPEDPVEDVIDIAAVGYIAGASISAYAAGECAVRQCVTRSIQDVRKFAEGIILEARSPKTAPVKGAEGPHSVPRPGPGQPVKGYATYKPNPKNPTGFDEEKRVDVVGKPHDGVPTPHVVEPGKPVRPARPDELPKPPPPPPPKPLEGIP